MPYNYSNRSIEYKYITADLMTDTILAELPLQDVSFTRALKDAGSFSGSVPVIADNDYLDLYETTMPGRTALYVLRDGVCVWGGIIWTRNYDIKERNLIVNASEFTSYFYRRVAWKTWNQELDATISTTGVGREAKVTITSGSFGYTAGMPIQLNFTEKLTPLTNIYTVNATPAPNSIEFHVTLPNTESLDSTPSGQSLGNVPLSQVGVTVTSQVDTFDYLKRLLEYLNTDFSEIEFPNSELAPEYNLFVDIASFSRAANVATITTVGDHGLISGQTMQISGLPVGFNSPNQVVIAVPSPTTFTYQSIGNIRSNTPITGIARNVSSLTIASLTETSVTQNITLRTATAHGYIVGNIIKVRNVDPEVDGTHIITGITGDTVTYQLVGLDDAVENLEVGGTVSSGPIVKLATYGSYKNNTDVGITVQTPDDALYSQKYITTNTLRGSSLTNIGEHLDKYTNTFDGFDYRVDCSYNKNTNKFSKKLVVVPLDPLGTLTTEQRSALGPPYPISAFGAEKLVFEHPGNILQAGMEENANDASTRFWVQGKNERGVNSEAGEPYAGVAMSGLLADGWPILDDVETFDSDDEFVLADYASRYLEESVPPHSIFSVTVNGSITPEVGTYYPGDWCSLIIDDVFVQLRMASGLEPRDGVLVRKIDAYTVTVPNSPVFPETVSLELYRESGVDPIGN